MTIANITIPVDTQTARIYTRASSEEKKKLRVLLSLWLREFAASPRPLKVVMDEISEKAQARGLTPAILESVLNAKGPALGLRHQCYRQCRAAKRVGKCVKRSTKPLHKASCWSRKQPQMKSTRFCDARVLTNTYLKRSGSNSSPRWCEMRFWWRSPRQYTSAATRKTTSSWSWQCVVMLLVLSVGMMICSRSIHFEEYLS